MEASVLVVVVAADDQVRAVIVTGTGEFFSAGTDLSAGSAGYDVVGPGFKPLRGGTRDVGGHKADDRFGENRSSSRRLRRLRLAPRGDAGTARNNLPGRSRHG